MAKEAKASGPGLAQVTLADGPNRGQARPLIVTSVNADGTVNGRIVHEPADNPTNDGNFQTFYRNVKV